jgi:hypothetical protein
MAELAAAYEAVRVRKAALKAEIKVLSEGLRERLHEQANAEYAAALKEVEDAFPDGRETVASKKRARAEPSAGGSSKRRGELQRIAGFNAPASATQDAIDLHAPRATRQSGGPGGADNSSAAKGSTAAAAAAAAKASGKAAVHTAAPAATARPTVKPPAAPAIAPTAAAAPVNTRTRTGTIVSPSPAPKSGAAPRFEPVLPKKKAAAVAPAKKKAAVAPKKKAVSAPKKKAAAAHAKKGAAPPANPTMIAHYPHDFGPAYKGSLIRMRFDEDGQLEWCTGTLGKYMQRSKLVRCYLAQKHVLSAL